MHSLIIFLTNNIPHPVSPNCSISSNNITLLLTLANENNLKIFKNFDNFEDEFLQILYFDDLDEIEKETEPQKQYDLLKIFYNENSKNLGVHFQVLVN